MLTQTQLIIYTHILLYIIVYQNPCKGAEPVRYTDLFKTKDHEKERRDREAGTGKLAKDSNRRMNYRLEMEDPSQMTEKNIQRDIKPGHTNREKLLPLLQQRNKNEEQVNAAMYVGLLLRKDQHKIAHPLMMYAQSQRLKAQEIQREMNKVTSEGHIDRHLWKADNAKLRKEDEGMNNKTNERSKRNFLQSNHQERKAENRESYKRKLDHLSPRYSKSQRRYSKQ